MNLDRAPCRSEASASFQSIKWHFSIAFLDENISLKWILKQEINHRFWNNIDRLVA
jgi:hypothetical protein